MKFLPQKVVVLVITAMLALSACQPGAPSQQDVETAVAATIAAMPTSTNTPVPTKTPTPTSTPVPTISPTPVIVNYGPDNFPDDVDPLTGLTVANKALLDRRPVMIKVANYPREGRPHAGLSFADIVFDYYTGEGGNRFVALFYGQDTTQAGPVRSGRYIDRYLAKMYQSVLTLVSAWPPELATIMDYLGWSRVISEGTNTCPGLCRDPELNKVMPEISVFGNSAELSKYYASRTGADNTRQDLTGMAFSTIPPAGGAAATEFTNQFGVRNIATWKYNSDTHKYMRWIEAVDAGGTMSMVPLVDRITDKQLEFSNVIVMFVPIDTLNKDDSMHEWALVQSSGQAYIFRDGMKYDVSWKSGYDKPIQFIDADGNVFALQPGNTWIHITGSSSSMTEESPGVWKTVIGLP